jgi:hypothetical protein
MVILKNIPGQQLVQSHYPPISNSAAPVVELSGPSLATQYPHSAAGYESKPKQPKGKKEKDSHFKKMTGHKRGLKRKNKS